MESVLTHLTPKKSTYYLLDNATIRQAMEKFDAHKFAVVPLLNKDGKYVGTISQGDILHFIKNENNFSLESTESVRINEIKKYRPYQAIRVTSSSEEIIALSLEQNFIPVVDDSGTYIGIIKRRDVINYLFNKND